MKILVTGAAGFIGSNLCEHLLNNGHEVVALDNFNDFYNPKLKEYNIKEFKDNPNFTLYVVDILDRDKLSDIFEKESIAGIVHLAAWAGVTPSYDRPQDYVRNNLEGTVNLIQLAVKHNVKPFIFASTSSVYGKKNAVPYKEEMSTDHPLAPYPATKKACEVMLSSYAQDFDLNVTILRIFNPLGIRQRPDLFLPKLVKSALHEDQITPVFWQPEEFNLIKRDYCYVGHILDSINHLLKNPTKYEIFNMGNSNPISITDMLKAVEEVVGRPAKIEIKPHRKGEMIETYANVSKAQNMIGFNPTTTIKENVRIYYEWLLKQEDWYIKG